MASTAKDHHDQTLSAGRWQLRRPRPGDAPALCQAVQTSLTELLRWMPWCRADYGLADAEGFVNSRAVAWQADESLDWAICDPADGQLLGMCGLNFLRRPDRTANLGYWVRSDRTRQGLATAAARAVAQWAFSVEKLHRLEIIVAAENLASCRVAWHLGASFEGRLRQRVQLPNQTSDALLYSLLESDWAKV